VSDDVDEPIEHRRTASELSVPQLTAHLDATLWMAPLKPPLQLTDRLRIAESHPGYLGIEPPDGVAAGLRCAESAPESIGKRIEVTPEVTAGTVDRLANDGPEILERRDPVARQLVDRLSLHISIITARRPPSSTIRNTKGEGRCDSSTCMVRQVSVS